MVRGDSCEFNLACFVDQVNLKLLLLSRSVVELGELSCFLRSNRGRSMVFHIMAHANEADSTQREIHRAGAVALSCIAQ